MGSVGMPELAVVFVVAILAYGIVMTIDAIRRPQSQYRFGKKTVWVVLLICTNPLVTRFFGGLVWLVGSFVFLTTAIAYHAQNRWGTPIQKESAA